ncbi:MAG: CYTH domain-containing protein [Rhodanobacter sp.]|jgi:adenylate cyclase|nr:CYTH domain-containing protein [Rhodanobacter sp.]
MIEIERKFLVADDTWRAAVSRSVEMVQGYLAGPPAARCSVRIRIEGERAFLNIKSAANAITRDEYEYPLPPADARHMLATLAGAVVQKCRHYVEIGEHVFEIDEFTGRNAGLIVAEIELEAEDQSFPRPQWLGREVSHLARYYNLNLADYPYQAWSVEERRADDALWQVVGEWPAGT